MSKTDRLLMLGLLCFMAGAALFLTGTPGPVIALAPIVLVVGALALVGSFMLRRRQPSPPPGVGVPPAAPGASRAGRIGAVAGAGLGTLAFVLALFVAQGEARSHGLFHLIFGAFFLGLFVGIDRWWRPREGTAASSLRTPLMVLLWVTLAGTFLEALGAAGYDRFNSGHRIPWLTTVHNAATPLGALTLVLIPIAIVLLVSALVRRSGAPLGRG